MKIRNAAAGDIDLLAAHDRHIAKSELERVCSRGYVLVCENDGGDISGWLRWGLFWDNTPFMNMLYVLDGFRGAGIGSALVGEWEKRMRGEGYKTILTSTQADEDAQHFYRKLGYVDSGVLLLRGEPSELIFAKYF